MLRSQRRPAITSVSHELSFLLRAHCYVPTSVFRIAATGGSQAHRTRCINFRRGRSTRRVTPLRPRFRLRLADLECTASFYSTAVQFHSGKFKRFSISLKRGSSRNESMKGSTFIRLMSQSLAAKDFSISAKARSLSPSMAYRLPTR